MSDLVPQPGRIDRAALERIVKRAAELQAKEREIGEGLTDQELMALGREVGIPASYLQQALVEERTHGGLAQGSRFGTWLLGPQRVAAGRVVPGHREAVEHALLKWMADGELLQVKRRYPTGISWERQEGAFASLKRSLGIGGKRYQLARTREVMAQLTPVENGRCHVQLVADISNSFRDHATGTALVGGGGVALSGVALMVGVLPLFATLPGLLAIPIVFGIARSRRSEVERVHVALEQVLDRLEHGEIRVAGPPGSRSGIVRIADEIRKSLG